MTAPKAFRLKSPAPMDASGATFDDDLSECFR